MFQANLAGHSGHVTSVASGPTMGSDIRGFLIRGSQKVIGHYELLLVSAKSEKERYLYPDRIEREKRAIDALLQGALPDRLAA